MRIVIIICGFILMIATSAQSQIKKYNSFYFVYVENTKLPGKEALTLSQKARVTQCIKSVKNISDMKFLLYMADGERPEIVDDVNKADAAAQSLYNKTYKQPEFNLDKNNLRKIIEEKPFGIRDTISINYFLSENYLNEYVLGKETGDMLNLFPREIAYILGVPTSSIIVNIYYSNSNRLIDEKNIRKAIEFYNKDDFKLSNYKFIKL